MNLLSYTIEQQGKAVFISCSDGKHILTNKWDEASGFLLGHCDYAVVWNIDSFTSTLATLLPKDISDKLLEGGRLYFGDRKLYYQPARLLGINYINLYGLSRYANDPVNTCSGLLELAYRVIECYHQLGIKEVTKLTSPIAVYAEKLKQLDFPRASDLPESAFPLINSCAMTMTREWRDTFKLGHWEKDEITDYDIRSAYPSLVAKLPDITNATFFSSDVMPPKYSWGELQGTLRITKPISPFYCEKVDGYPMNEWEDSITTDQLWLLNKWGIGSFQMKHGDFFLLPEKYQTPFKPTMENLYKVRSQSELMSTIAKGISVGIWGKFAERYEERLGDSFNSIYARMVTSRCIVLVADFIYRNQLENDVVSILVDGLLATKRLNLPENNTMGAWRENPPNPALVLSTLYQWIGEKRPALMDYKQIIELIEKQPNSSVYGDVDMKLLEYSRIFNTLPKNGKQLVENKYTSKPPTI